MKQNILPFPRAVQCHNCEHAFVGAICPLCREERPSYTALKAITARAKVSAGEQPITAALPVCRYFPKALCNCGLRGQCLPAA